MLYKICELYVYFCRLMSVYARLYLFVSFFLGWRALYLISFSSVFEKFHTLCCCQFYLIFLRLHLIVPFSKNM